MATLPAVLAIFIAMFLDAADGRVARITMSKVLLVRSRQFVGHGGIRRGTGSSRFLGGFPISDSSVGWRPSYTWPVRHALHDSIPKATVPVSLVLPVRRRLAW